MMENDKKEHFFNMPDSPNAPEEQERHFEADLPKTTRKETRRGGFGSDFVPKRDARGETAPREPGVEEGATPRRAASDETVKEPVGVWNRFLPTDVKFEHWRLAILLIFFGALTIFSFWPSISDMVYKWYTNVDYSHGFIVIPFVALCLYLRLDTYPGTRYGLNWLGLVPILLCFAMRYFAAGLYIETLDQWSILLWIFGIVWFFYGNRVFLWALPSLSFLLFMFPLPWRFEVLMRNQLQQIAAQFAAVILQVLGEPAIPIKNTIRLSTEELAVDAACSGIRFLISILAIAFAAILLMRRPWWQNILVVLITVPLALFVNASRIAMTGILLVHFRGVLEGWTAEGQRASVLADGIAGITMIVVAWIIFLAFLWYLGKVFRRVEI